MLHYVTIFDTIRTKFIQKPNTQLTMSLKKYIERIERMNWLISKSATGAPSDFARKMNISRSLLMEYLKFMKQLGGAIKYDTQAQSYIYLDDREFYCGFISKEKDQQESVNESSHEYQSTSGPTGSMMKRKIQVLRRVQTY